MIKLKNINLKGLNSELINNLSENNDSFEEFELELNITEKNLYDFNKRIINLNNINSIIKICDYLLINNVLDFLIQHSIPTKEKYIIENYELSDIPKYNLPKFMTDGVWNQLELNYIQELKNKPINDYFYDFIFIIKNFCHSIQEIVSYGLINWINFYIKHYSEEFTKNGDLQLCSIAAYNNKLECMIYLNQQKVSKINENCYTFAALNNNMDIIKYLHKNNINYDKSLLDAAAFNGSLESLEYIHKNIVKECFVSSMSQAALNGNLNCMKYLFGNDCDFYDDRNNSCLSASVNDNIECFKYAYKNNCELEISLELAVRNNSMKIIRFILNNKLRGLDKSTDENIMKSCVKYGDLDLYKFCRNELNIPKNITERYLNFVCERQSDEILKHIVEVENIKISSDLLLFAVHKDSLACVKYILKLDIHHNLCFDYPYIIIRNGNLEMLKLFLNKFPQLELTEWNVPFSDNYELWDYIINKKIKINSINYYLLSSSYNDFRWFKSLDSIKVLERTKILWNEKLTNVLAFFGLFDFLVYVLSKGCKIGPDFF